MRKAEQWRLSVQRMFRPRPVPVVENVFHCCVHKTASQWLRKIFADPRTFEGCGLRPYNYEESMPGGADSRPLTERTFEGEFPRHTIVTPIYIDLPGFERIPKREPFRAFFVSRDPRDLVVSRYFSMKHSHKVMGPIGAMRERLRELSEEDGLALIISSPAMVATATALRSWQQGAARDGRLRVFSYEALTGDGQFDRCRELMSHCQITVPDGALRQLLQDYSFRSMTEGRERGVEDVHAHLRKGVAGDWRNHFTTALCERFRAAHGTLAEDLGYAW